jgi:hypothetical protein
MRNRVIASILVLGLTLGLAGCELELSTFPSPPTASELQSLHKLAEKGDAKSQDILGGWYEMGWGLPKDYAEAVKWYRKAASQGYAWAQYSLGVMYEYGRGVPQDYAEAVKWWRKAADQGNAFAQISLGVMYEYGQGVPKDYVLADTWFRLSIPSSTMPSDLEKQMTPKQIAEAKKLASEWKAVGAAPAEARGR